MAEWKKEAKRLWLEEKKTWTEITREVMRYFPGKNEGQVREIVRTYIRRTPEYKEKHRVDSEKSSVEYRKDGSIISEKFIQLRDGDEMNPAFILEAHGLDPKAWELVSYKNNLWNTQIKGGSKQISYQSKVTAKPISKKIDLDEVDKHFAALERKNLIIRPARKIEGRHMAEVNILDLHFGKLCWHGDTPDSFDHKIARDVFYSAIGDIVPELKAKPYEYITFCWASDFFNTDNIEQTTTKGTPQDVDSRFQKLFSQGCEMLVKGIETLAEIANVYTFYTPSNHDQMTSYHAIKFLEAWFKNDGRVRVDTKSYPRKYQLYGNTLIGYCHGDKESSVGSKEKASRLASLMPIEAADLWGKAKYREMHVGHLHSEHAIQEINGVIVRRISSPTAADTWHTESGFVGSVRKVQTFIYDKERGLVNTINTPIS